MPPSNNYWIFLFPLIFVGLWLLVGTLLGVMSGWFGLMRRFPDRPQPAILKLNNAYGSMGGVNFNGILVLSVCPDGLRIGVWRIFAPFARNIFVPWVALSVTRRDRVLWKIAVLRFGASGPQLKIMSHVADRLAAAARGHWPEPGLFRRETAAEAAIRIGSQWFVSTALAATFFIVVPRMDNANTAWPPLAVAILFPAIVFGIVSLFRFFGSMGGR
jgi:hypothetical protein